jgi:hypothetical protein
LSETEHPASNAAAMPTRAARREGLRQATTVICACHSADGPLMPDFPYNRRARRLNAGAMWHIPFGELTTRRL